MIQSFAELTLACIFWAWGFIATKLLVSSLSPGEITLVRFFLSFVIAIVIIAPNFNRKYLSSSLLPGSLLAATIIAQIESLKHTEATKVAFITGLYVLVVPLLNVIIGNRFPLTLNYILSLILAMIGTILLNINTQFSWGWGLGETLALISCFAAAAHIVAIERVVSNNQSTMQLNAWSFFWVSLIAGIWFIFEIQSNPSQTTFFFTSIKANLVHLKDDSALPTHLIRNLGLLLSLVIFSTIIAFALQIRNQKKLHSNLASIIFLLESPMTLFLAWFVLGEQFRPLQLIGMSLIFFGCLLSLSISKRN
ncbi:MAG: DMT family transporter [Bdellovibrionaceae bacterium]|nr:DMT family transporter [Pseudobdellovibrionaceae bacterium]MDW8190953.1 DMT family transporter [Pseudobdellovibrionaceae bacterium]